MGTPPNICGDYALKIGLLIENRV